MSQDVFPDLPGLAWSAFKTPRFNTRIQESVSLAEVRASFSATPIYDMKLTYDVLRDSTVHAELRQLAGFFLAHRGKFDSWLFTDPTDNSVTDQMVGLGDGSEVEFQLVRTFGTFTEKVSNVNVISSVTVNNTPTSNYTVSNVGLVTFNSAPAANAAVRWSGTYYFRCRFTQDAQEFENFMYQLWQAQTVGFMANLGTKLGTAP